MLPRALRNYPAGVLVEEFIAGTDVTVPFLEGRGDDGVLLPVDYVVDPQARSRFNIYDYRLKTADSSKVHGALPADLPRDVVVAPAARSRRSAVRALGIRDVGRIDFRLGEDGRIYLLEVNALPSLEPGAGLFAAAAREGLDLRRDACTRSSRAPRKPPGAGGASRAREDAARPTRCASASPTT